MNKVLKGFGVILYGIFVAISSVLAIVLTIVISIIPFVIFIAGFALLLFIAFELWKFMF